MIRVALPRGDLRASVAAALDEVDFVVDGYGSGSRAYHFEVAERPGVRARVFSERDIPIQVALGQYDVGITSRAWLDELFSRYGSESVVALRSLAFGSRRIVLAGPRGATLRRTIGGHQPFIVTEYPQLAGRFLNRLRLTDYRSIEVWGNAHAWPPDDADAAIVSIADDDASGLLAAEGLEPLADVHAGSACLIVNRRALRTRDVSEALEPLLRLPGGPVWGGPVNPFPLGRQRETLEAGGASSATSRETIRIAVPDGHAQRHTVEALEDVDLSFDGYEAGRAVRRPRAVLDGVEVKVIRPQDMPQAIALGRFDLAMTGRDWLAAHLAAFPSSPVVELADLWRSRYQLGAVVSEDVPADTIEEAVAYWRRADPGRPIRIASEYAPLADRYGRDHHLGRYLVIPISGASEGFVPEDADILIEGSETGETLRANRLRMIDVIMESTNCVIGSTIRPDGARGLLRDDLVDRFRAARAPEVGSAVER